MASFDCDSGDPDSFDPYEYLDGRINEGESAVEKANRTLCFDHMFDAWLACRCGYMMAFAIREDLSDAQRERLRKLQKRTVAVLRNVSPFSPEDEYARHYINEIGFHRKVMRLAARGRDGAIRALFDERLHEKTA